MVSTLFAEEQPEARGGTPSGRCIINSPIYDAC